MNKEMKELLLEKLQGVGGINKKSCMSYVLQHFSEVARVGIAMSRREITRGSDNLSPFIHSWNTFHRYMGIAKEFVTFCVNHHVNKLHKLQYENVEAFLMEKIQRGNSRNTIETNMCALKKFFNASERPDLSEQLDKDYTRLKYLAREGGSIHAFDNPDKLIERIVTRSVLSAVIAKLEHLTGARIHEVRTMQVMENSIVIPKGKGGKRRVLDFSYRLDELAEIKDLIARLKELSNGVNWREYCQSKDSAYQRHVKAACRSLGDEYVGAHGFRANYAQELCKKLEDKGLSVEEIELIITRDLGHERRSMARHYLTV